MFLLNLDEKSSKPKYKQILDGVRSAIEAVMEDDQNLAQDVIGMKNDIARLASEALAHQAERLVAPEPGRLEAYSLEIDLIEKLKRIYYFAKRMAKDVIPDELLNKAA